MVVPPPDPSAKTPTDTVGQPVLPAASRSVHGAEAASKTGRPTVRNVRSQNPEMAPGAAR